MVVNVRLRSLPTGLRLVKGSGREIHSRRKEAGPRRGAAYRARRFVLCVPNVERLQPQKSASLAEDPIIHSFEARVDPAAAGHHLFRPIEVRLSTGQAPVGRRIVGDVPDVGDLVGNLD